MLPEHHKASFGYPIPREDWPGFTGINPAGMKYRSNQLSAFGYTRPGSIPGRKPVESVNSTGVKNIVPPPVDEIPRCDSWAATLIYAVSDEAPVGDICRPGA
jgi:hypothetical protein